MEGPKYRRLILFMLVLFVGGALLLARQRTSTTEPVRSRTTNSARPLLDTQPVQLEAPTIEVPPAAAATLRSSTTRANFRGRVIDALTRQPLEEFEVQLIRVRREAHTEDPPIIRSFKSASGRFGWADVAEGTWRAAVSAPGHQMFNVGVLQISEGNSTNEIVMPLLRGFAVHGRVFESSTGAGIVGASISFRPDDSPGFGSSTPLVESKQDGAFTLDGIPGGHVVLTVHARNHAYREITILVDEKTPRQEIALSTGATIAGIVMTTAGVATRGRILLKGPGLAGHLRETNEAGQFSFDHMPPGRYRVSADTSAGGATHELTLGQDEIKQDITLIVGAGRTVRGTLAGLQTEQLQSARILLRSRPDGAVFNAIPDERGAYALNGVPPGRAVMTVFTDSFQLEKPVDVPADRDVTIDITFPAGARLSGRVTQGGRPAAHRNVWMSPVERDSKVSYRVRTSADGQYEIKGAPPGDYYLRADEDISRTIAIADDTVLNIDIPLAQWSARVVEEGGTVPIVGANVYARGSAPETARVRIDKRTDNFGQVTLTGLEPGEIVLIVYQPGYEMHREKIAYSSPITDGTITLRKSAGVEVRVQPGSRRFPRGFTLTQSIPPNDHVVDLWMPIDREGICHVPSALAGTTFQIGRFSGTPIVIEEWNGQPFELQ